MNKAVDIISRKAETQTSFVSAGNLNISLQEPSILVIHGASADVARYERQGSDLLIVMKDGSVIRCNGYFIEDSEQHHGELVFEDENGTLTHVTFGEIDPNTPVDTMILEPTETSLTDIQSLIYSESESDDYSLAVIAGALLGGAAIGALANNGGNDSHKIETVETPAPQPEAVVTPTFITQDKTGDKQGLLNNNDVTDEKQPTFSGSGQSGSTIQIKNESGNVIASAQVASDGTWQVIIPTQSVGSHTYSVVQITGDKTIDAGNITLEIVAADATISFSPVADDNMINAGGYGSEVEISGQATGLAVGTALTLNLNGSLYQTVVGAEGKWTVNIPAGDVAQLADSQYVLTITGQDAAGNTVSGSHNIVVNTLMPVVIINTIGGDDVWNASEVTTEQAISGRVINAEVGQTVTVSLNGKQYTTTVNVGGTWSVNVPPEDLAALANGSLTVTANVSNQAGNVGQDDREITIDIGLPELGIDTVAGDDIINAIELTQPLIISGTSTDLVQGSVVTVNVNGKEYMASVSTDGSWNIGITAEDVAAFPAGELEINAAAQNASGNPINSSHHVSVDLTAVAISIDAVTGDNVLNAGEKEQDLVLTGLTQNVESGQTVTITMGGHSYQTTVGQDNRWTVTIPSTDLSELSDGINSVSVSVSNVAGNHATTAQEVRVDTAAPVIAIDTLAGNDILNSTEVGQPLTISGTSVNAEAGQTVTVSLNGKDYTTTLNADGSWHLEVGADDLSVLAEGTATVTATVSDKAGNTSSTSHDMQVALTAPIIAIDIVAGDDVINHAEHEQSQVISGTTVNAVVGDAISVEINGHTYNTTVNADGTWSVDVPARVIGELQNGTVTITATITDKAGNSSNDSHDVLVNTLLPTLSIDTIAGDDVINATEKGESLTISGTSTDVAPGLTVIVSLNGQSYSAIVSADGSWSLDVPAVDVAKLGEANYSVSVSVTDGIGNTASASHDVLVNTAPPQVIVNAIGGNDILNASEVATEQTINGRVVNAEAGQTVTVSLGGQDYTTTVNNDGTWSVNIPSADLTALGDGLLNVTATVTNQVGNQGHGDREIAIDAGLPGLRIDTVAGDDIINAIELGQPLTIGGTSTDLAAGSVVTVIVNDKQYIASVNADGTWNLVVPASDVADFQEGKLVISANAIDGSGNSVTHLHQVVVDLDVVAISINAIAGDNMLNAEEKGQDLTLSGSTQNVEQGQTVTVNVGGKNHLATVDADGNWTVTVTSADLSGMKEGTNDISVSVTNAVGNGASATQNVQVDTIAPTITIHTLAGDDILNAEEAGQALTISGTTFGAQAGQTVTVSLNGNEYTATVDAKGKWTLDVPADDVGVLPTGDLDVTATVSDKAGNEGTASHNLLVDVTVPTITIGTVAGDDVINAVEHGLAQIISGTTLDAVAGDQVSVVINGHSYFTVVNADGNWSVGVPANVISALQNGTVTITATIIDKAGNSSNDSHDVLVNTLLPTLSIDTIAGDDVINATEKGSSLTISGTTTEVAPGLTVNVNLNGQTYSAIVNADGSWCLDVPAADVAKLGEANYSVSASVADGIGNSASASHDVLVNTALPQVIVNAIGGNDILNASEVATEQTISGRVVNAEAGQTVTVSLAGNNYTTTVNSDGTWSVKIPSADLMALGDGDLKVTASVTNQAGNEGYGDREIAIAAGLPGLRIDTVAGDDIINAIELGQSLVINGTSTGLDIGSTVNLTVNGKEYSASVNADGSWSVGIPASDVGQFPAGTLVISASGTDTANNHVSVNHNVSVDLTSVSISIDTIADDNVINAQEKGQDLQLTGQTLNVEAGQTVTVSVGGKTYAVKVNANGSWALTVAAADLNGLKDGMNDVSVSVTNAAGNTASAAQEVRVDTLVPTITMNTLAGDDILNAEEAGQPLTVSGITVGVEAGQTVTVNLGGKNFTTTVNSDGSWSLDVPANNLSALADGNVSVTAKVSDKAGNEGSTSHNLVVDTAVPTIVISPVAGDDIINATEHAQDQIIRGTTTNATVGDSVVVVIDGHAYNTTVNSDGSWSVGVSAAAISALQDGTTTITATITDKAGNSGSASHDVLVSTAIPALEINVIAGDDIINATEKGQDLTISGTTQNVDAGLSVSVILNGKTYTALVNENGDWTLNVPASDVAALGEAIYTVIAHVSDSVGNSITASHNVVVNTALPGITIDTIAGDDIINATEIQSDQTISGKVYNVEVGQLVTVTVNNQSYQATVEAGGKWSVNIPAADWQAIGNGSLAVTAEVSNQAGNSHQATHDVVIDANLPGIRIGVVSGDDVINIIEQSQNLIVKGSSEGFEPGAILKVTANGISYDAIVGNDGNWIIDIPAADVANFPAGTLTITAQGQNAIGESVSNSHLVNVDLTSTAISINTVAGDNIINAAEKGQPITLGGSVAGIEEGQTVTLIIGGMTYTTTVLADGTWAYTLSANAVAKLAEGNLSITASAESQAGNSADSGRQVLVNSQVPAISINTISGDDLINAAEHAQALTISGTSHGLENGREITVTLNGESYTALVAKDGNWTLNVPANVVSGLADGPYAITASGSNVAGNGISANHSVTVDTIPPTVTIDNVTNDNMLNAEEHAHSQVLSGTSNAIGQIIYVTIGGETYSTEVRKDGTWVVGVPASVINSLNEGTNTVDVSIADKAGNVTTDSKDFEVVAGVPTLSINTISGDNVINQLEHGESLEISGTASSNLIGRDVTVTLNGKEYTATVSEAGTWTLTVDAADVSELDGDYYRVTASASDISGNAANTGRDLALDLIPPSLLVSDIAIDNIINAVEHDQPLIIKGTYGGAENGQIVTVTLNDKEYTVAVTGNGYWSVIVPANDVQALVDGDYSVNVSLSDKAGNVTEVDKPLVVDTIPPTITIDPITGDDSIDVGEQALGVTISGTTTAEAGQTLVVSFNGRNYSATVNADSTWSVNVPSAHFNGIVDGTYSVVVTVSDNAGNPASISHDVAVVTQLPALTIDTFAGDDMVNGDEHQLSQVISGTSDAIGQTVTVTFNGKTYSNIQVENDGTWRVTVSATDMQALTEGLTEIHASVTSATGNSYSTSKTVEVDLTPPAATVVIDSITNDTGASSNDFITADDHFVIHGSISSTLGAGEYAQISLDNGVSWQTLTLINNQWTLDNGANAWAEGEHIYYMRVVDAAGNVGTVTNHKVMVDTTAPDQVITISHITEDTGTYDDDFVTYDTTPSVFGNLSYALASDETLQIRLDGGSWMTVTNITGTEWQFDTLSELSEGNHTYELRVIDLAGNIGSSVSQDITIDITPSTVSASIVSFTDHTGTNQGNYPSGTETDETLPTLNGTLTAMLSNTDTVRIYVDGVWVGNATVSGTSWTYDIKTALAEGSHTFTAVVTDLAGNEGILSPEFSLIVDTIAPTETATIVSYTDEVGLYQGDFGSGTYTDDPNVVLNGTLSGLIKATDVVRLYEGNTLVGTATVNGTDWTYSFANLPEGEHQYHVVVSDAAGNEGPASNDFVFTVDVTAPTSIITVDNKLTADTTPTITGTVTNLGADETLWIKVNGVVYREGIDSALSINRTTNTWALVIDSAHALNVNGVLDQVYNVDARITDQAGNFSEVSTKDQLTVYSDTAIIRSPSADYMAEVQPVFIVKGTAGTGETMIVEVRDADGTLIKTFSSADGSLVRTADSSYTIAASAWGSTKLTSGEYSINSYVNVADGSGGQASAVEHFTIIEPNTAQNVTNSNDDSASRVYATSDGGYWMFWASATSANGSVYNLYAQRYNQSGGRIGNQITVSNDSGQNNSNNLQYIRLYDVYMKDDDSFSVFYSSGAAQIPYLQNFDSNGNTVGGRVSITNTLAFELTPTYVSMADGSYALVFNSGTISNYNVYAIRYDANGTALDSRPVALTTGTNQNNGFGFVLGGYVGQPTGTGTSTATTTQGMSAVDIGDGKYAVLYMSSKSGSVGGTDMYMKVIDFSTGKEISGSEIKANAFTDKMQIGASMVALKGGGFIGVWASNTGSAGNYGTMDGFDVYARRFDWDVATQKLVTLDDTEVRVNTSTDGVNGVAFNALSVNLSVAALEQGGYVVVWSKFTAANKSDVYAQSFDAVGNKLGGETLISTETVNLDTLPSVTALADGGYVVSWNSMTTSANYLNGRKNDINSVIVNADGTIRGTGDTNSYEPTASYIDGAGILTGNDSVNTLDGRHGATVMNGGAGNDYIIISDTNFISIDGGAGFDTLIWDSTENLNFSDISHKVTGIEAIHLGDKNANQLTLTLNDVVNASDTTDVLVIQGGSSDSVNLTDAGWYSVGSQIWRGDTYQVLLNTYDIHASLWVQNGVVVKNDTSAFVIDTSLLTGSEGNDVIAMDNSHEVVNIGNGGHDTLLYKLLNSDDAIGGHEHSVVNGFTVGSWENTSETDRVDLSSLLQNSGYTGTASASYVNGVATLDSSAGDIADYINVRVEDGNTIISIDRDGTGGSYSSTDLVTISGVQTDLATLLANHQLLVI